MASYVEAVLAEGERVVYRARISQWKFLFHYVASGLFVLVGLSSIIMSQFRESFSISLAAVSLLLGVAILTSVVIQRFSTELVITNRRVIAKRGFISRDTLEMNLSKLESIRVSQGLLGRILNYGDVTVVGTGSSPEPLRGIASPLELRKQIGEVLPDVPSMR